MIPLDDRGKSVQEMRRDWTKMIRFLESVLSYRYTPETEVLLFLARNNLDEVEIEVRPSTTEPLFGAAPLRYDENGDPVYNVFTTVCEKSDFLPDLFDEEVYPDQYKGSFVAWISSLLNQINQFHSFPYPLYLSFKEDYPHYYDLRVGKFTRYQVSRADQENIMMVFDSMKDEFTYLFREIFSHPYTEETEVIVLDALFDHIYSFSVDSKPVTEAFEEVPLYYDRSGKPVYGNMGFGGTFNFERALDIDTIIEEGFDSIYQITIERLFVKWMTDFLANLEGYHQFPYPIIFTYENLFPDYYDLQTGKLIRQTDWTD